MSKLPKLVLNRNYVLSTMVGHSIAFEKGVPIDVPPTCYAAAIGIGAVTADGAEPNVLQDKEVDRTPIDPQERSTLILVAVEELVARNDRNDFTAAGKPAVDAVNRELGFRATGKEIDTAWQRYHADKAGE